tara:strand:+ start:262 stop:471 length:210 start_codon:yes stop_codon:yes gene_type:complete
MKTIKLTKRQYEELQSAFMQGANAHLNAGLWDEAFDDEGNVIDKKLAKEYNAYMRVIKKLEQKLNCKVP